jgi:nickel-dependent lactate racemase
MRVSVDYQDEQIEFDVSTEALVGSWRGPVGLAPERVGDALQGALEHPIDFPALRQMLVPGDRVAIALDGSLTGIGPILLALKKVLDEAGVSAQDVTVVATPESRPELAQDLPQDMTLVVHDPSNREGLAYLAATQDGRRIYLNRHLIDADVVIPVGRAGFDPVVGYRGPWSVVFPGLSQEATRVSYRERLADDPSSRLTPPCRLEEPIEVSWLLGTQFHLAIVPGVAGPAGILAGLAESVRDQAIRAVNESWVFHASDRAECVVAGIGAPGSRTGLPDLVDGLVTASRLVHQGGKIIALSRACGSIGPSLQRLKDAADSKMYSQSLRGHESDVDSVSGRRLAQVLAWADVYLLSGFDHQSVEDLSMIPLDRDRDAGRLVTAARSCLLVSQADLTRAVVGHE